MTEQEIIHKLEKKFGFLLNLYPVGEDGHGGHVFSCVDIDKEAYITVDKEGWVFSRLKGKKFADVLGSIH